MVHHSPSNAGAMLPTQQRVAAPSLLDLPEGCLVEILRHLPAKDLVAAQAISKTFRALAKLREAWEPRLEADFGLRVRASGAGHVDWHQLYMRSEAAPRRACIRFRGTFTDGGCDEGLQQHWVDNMFAPNHFETYCSALDKNVNCIGLLLDEGIDPEAAAEARRNYIIGRCRLPAAAMFGDHQALLHAAQEQALQHAAHIDPALEAGGAAGQPPLPVNAVQHGIDHALDHVIADLLEAHQELGQPLAMEEAPAGMQDEAEAGEAGGVDWVDALFAEVAVHPHALRLDTTLARLRRWTTAALEQFFMMMWGEMQQAHQLGYLLLLDVKPSERQREAQRLMVVVASITARRSRPLHHIFQLPGQPDVMLHSQLAGLLSLPHATSSVGVVTNLSISRQGQLSCPCRCGVLLMGDMRRAVREVRGDGTSARHLEGCTPQQQQQQQEGGTGGDRVHENRKRSQSGLGVPQDREQADVRAGNERQLRITRDLQGVAAEPISRLFDDVASREALRGLCTSAPPNLDALPPVVAMGGCPGAEWVEFNPELPQQAGASGGRVASSSLRPMAWFHFYDAEERHLALDVLQDLADEGSLTHYQIRFEPPLQAEEYHLIPFLGDGLTAEHMGTDPALYLRFGDQEAGSSASEAVSGSGSESEDNSCPAASSPISSTSYQASGWHPPSSTDGHWPLPGSEGGCPGPRAHERMHVITWRKAPEIEESNGEDDEDGVAGPDGLTAGDTRGRNKLSIQLTRRHVGNLALVKLISPENLMSAWRDHHPQPNIDMCSVVFEGRKIELPLSVHFL